MQLEKLTESIAQIYVFFRYKEMPHNNAINSWHGKLKHIPDIYVDKITTRITDLDNIPRNIPKIFNAFYSDMKATSSAPIEYDLEEDLRYPVSKLWDAFNILENKGNEAFYDFCTKTKMPMEDRERVMNKHKGVFNMGKLKTMVQNLLNDANKIPGYAPKEPKQMVQELKDQEEIPF